MISRQAKKTPLKVFLEKDLQQRISTDRVDVAPPEVITVIADKSAANRSGPFLGWAVVSLEAACADGRQVCASPQHDNPYHADIVLPVSATLDSEEQEDHAQQLAMASRWRERPASSDG